MSNLQNEILLETIDEAEKEEFFQEMEIENAKSFLRSKGYFVFSPGEYNYIRSFEAKQIQAINEEVAKVFKI